MINLISEYLDKPILRAYRRIGKKWENRGHSIYSLSSMVGIPSNFTLGGCLISLIDAPRGDVATLITGFLNGADLLFNLYGIRGQVRDDYNADAMVVNPRINFYRKVNRIVRVPEFLAGPGFIAKAGYDVFRSVVSNEPLDPNIGLYFVTGLAFLGSSSSMYLKDRDPKLLEREPSKLKSALKKLTKRIKDLSPKPTPVPQPAFQRIEEMFHVV